MYEWLLVVDVNQFRDRFSHGMVVFDYLSKE